MTSSSHVVPRLYRPRHGCVSSFEIDDYSETGARKLVANLLGNLKPGLRVEDVYQELV